MRIAARGMGVLALIAALSMAVTAFAGDEAKTLVESKRAFQELLASTDHKVPDALLQNAKCVVVIPSEMKAAVGVGVQTGEGVMSCRTADGWGTPVFVSLKGANWGAQIGVQKTEAVLFFMTEKGMKSLMTGKSLKLGGELSVAAGPFGRTAEASTDLKLNSEIYSYAKSKGAFIGASLSGASLHIDKDDNAKYYGKTMDVSAMLSAKPSGELPADAEAFRAALTVTTGTANR